MAEEKKLDYSWPPMDNRRVMGKRTNRIDGFAKVSGRMKYASDIKRPGLLFGAVLTSPHANCRVKSIDTSAAEKSQGVAGVEVVAPAGTSIPYAGFEVAAVAASTEQQARDALRKIKVDYEIMPHVVNEEDLSKVANRAKPSTEQVVGDPDAAFKEADAVSEGFYAIPVLTHSCLEPHGQVMESRGAEIEYWSSSQNVSGIGGEIAKALEVPVTNVHVHQDAVGGAFGSKFSADRWGIFTAQLSKKAGKPVKLFLDRRTELEIAGIRPSDFAKIKVAAKKDGTVTAWQSESWSTGGFTGGAMPPIPYIFTRIPNKRLNHTAVQVNAAPSRAWRAPNHPQASLLTFAALDDLAAKLEMDPIQFYTVNAQYATPQAHIETYRFQLQKAAELAEWKKLWHPRGKGGTNHLRQGLGIGFSTWGGLGNDTTVRTRIHPDGSVELETAGQDLGTGTRTIIAMVAAETLGLPVNGVKVKIGENSYPPAGASGGSTTVGGVSVSTRRSTMNALAKLYEKVAPGLGAQPEQLEAVDGRVQVKDDPKKSLTWQAACRKMGTSKISEMGENQPRNTGGLNTGGVGGVEVADVSVDTETGIVRVNKFVCVQDCGMVINPKLAESQCYGGITMGISTALYEERIMDEVTGRQVNTGLDTYKLAGIGDIGQIVVHLDIAPEHDKRGVIGLGEPPAIGIQAAIGNAVANAIGVRVSSMPMTPDRVLAALEGRNA